MQKIHEQQDHAANGLNTHISRATGDQDTGIRSQVELESEISELRAENEVLVRECKQAAEDYQDALEGNCHKDEKIKEMTGQIEQAASVICGQQKEILRLKGELCDYLEQVVRNQQNTIKELNAQLGDGS